MDRQLGSPRSHPFCLKMCLLLIFVPPLFSRGLFAKVWCHRAPRVITVTVEQKLGWAAQVAQSCFHHQENVFLWGRNNPPLTCCIYSEYTQEERPQIFFISPFCTNVCNKLRQIFVASLPLLFSFLFFFPFFFFLKDRFPHLHIPLRRNIIGICSGMWFLDCKKTKQIRRHNWYDETSP